ncbi:hypothetical protein EDB19DRAFT_1920545 [Suillus lakei]|nr:hypothetical protein EDB19DRAFT_1920545 [Suillus lakei]
MDLPLVAHSLPLNRQAIFFEYVILGGKRYYASRTVGSNRSSFIHAIIPSALHPPRHAYGEVLELFQFEQNFRGPGHDTMLWFARTRWFKPWRCESTNPWDDFSTVDVRLWELGEYQNRNTQLPELINPDWIVGQLAMTTVSIGENKIKAWASINLSKRSTPYILDALVDEGRHLRDNFLKQYSDLRNSSTNTEDQDLTSPYMSASRRATQASHAGLHILQDN